MKMPTTVTAITQAQLGVFVNGSTNVQISDINGELQLSKWSSTNLTWALPTSLAQYGYSFAASAPNFQAVTSAVQVHACQRAIQNFDDVSNLTLTFTTNAAAANLRYAFCNTIDYGDGQQGAHTPGRSDTQQQRGSAEGNFPDDPAARAGDMWFWNGNTGYVNPVPGTYGYGAAFLHELGHALGLKHGHADLGVVLPTDHNSQEYSIMTYSMYSFPGSTTDRNGFSNPQEPASDLDYSQSLMIDDILAIQYMYGADYTTRATATTYSWDPSSGVKYTNGQPLTVLGAVQEGPIRNRVFETIWDGGGIDTYDFSNYNTGIQVDLRPGYWSTISGAQLAYLGDGHFARGNIANAEMVNSDIRSLIENATGGAGNDVISGNIANNVLRGGAGSDALNGKQGVDDLYGGRSADRFVFDLTALTAIGGSPNFDTVIDFNRGDYGFFVQAEGDVLDLREALSYGFSTGASIDNLIRVVEDPNSAWSNLQLDADGRIGGTRWVTIARVAGTHQSEAFKSLLSDNLPTSNLYSKASSGYTGDFNGDGRADILWRNDNGAVAAWIMNGNALLGGGTIGQPGNNFHTVGAGDFNGDGRSDVLFLDDSGAVSYWQMLGLTIQTGTTIATGVTGGLVVAGIGDLNNDNKDDIIYRAANGQVYGVLTGVSGFTTIAAPGLDWHLNAVGDFNGDNKDDILWRNDSGLVLIWQMNGNAVQASIAVATPSPDWHIEGTGDFNGDHLSDILWRNDDGSVLLWLMNGGAVLNSAIIGQPGNDWQIGGYGDYNADGMTDILWRNENGTVLQWFMNGFGVNAANVGQPGQEWKTASHHYDFF
jgi:FG-GAP-like repeat/Peptidase M10 serralysin C terminal